MRLVKVKAPAGRGAEVAQVAFSVGISRVSVHEEHVYEQNQRRQVKDAVDIDTSTPAAKAFLDALMSAPFFDPKQYSISVRQPRTVVSPERPSNVTWPIVLPTIDVFEELWQFSHVTSSFVGRVSIAGLLLAYGMIQNKLLLIIAGLLFLPFLPLILAIGFGVWTREWRLARQGGFALAVGATLTAAGGALVALIAEPPLRFQEFSPLHTSFLISLGVGVAAGLATADDVGRRELIGLAATAQVALLPAWFGISLVFGFSASPFQRLATFLVNVGTILCTSLGTYALLGMRGDVVRRYARDASN